MLRISRPLTRRVSAFNLRRYGAKEEHYREGHVRFHLGRRPATSKRTDILSIWPPKGLN